MFGTHYDYLDNVSTRSRPKAADWELILWITALEQFQHAAARRRLKLVGELSQLDVQFQHAAARRRLININCIAAQAASVSTRSRPKAAENINRIAAQATNVSTRSRPKAADGLPFLPELT